MKKIKTLKELNRLKEKSTELIYPHKTKVLVGMATCGLVSGAQEVFQAIREEVKEKKLDIILARTGCIGFCQKEPLVDIIKPGWPKISYCKMNSKKAKEAIYWLIQGKIKKEWILAKLEKEERLIEGTVRSYPLNGLPKEIEEIPLYEDIPFYKKQIKIAMRNCGFIDPENIEEYIARAGYSSLYKVLTQYKPEEVIEEITKAGLRGRGGAGFPTGKKWKFGREASGEIKYIICNADEGDPGAYMDRSVLEGDPHSVLEGIIIGAYAIGANKGYIYARNEYPLAVKNMGIAVKQAEEYGFLGENIFGSGFDFTVEISRGAGAFVCGEETALIASIEGRRGMPQLRPPYPVNRGLWGHPTVINNVETWANVPLIIARGASWYSKIGTRKSKGTKIFSLVGKIKNTGLVEVPMGITLREIIYDIGGGTSTGKKLKAIQIGGPSGGCLPLNLMDTAVDYEAVTGTGAIMGSGGLVVMDEDTCMVDVARYFLNFTQNESCGKCTFCRVGTKRMLEILSRITEGKGCQGDIELLEELAEKVKANALCGLGQTAPNPVLTTLKYFREEYEAHIHEKRCPAAKCKGLITYKINPEKCTGCGACKKVCFVEAISGERKKAHIIDDEKCVRCGNCVEVCKFEAVEVE